MRGSTQTIQQQQTMGDTKSDWSQTATFAQFLPSLRTPQSIDVGLTADTTGSISVEIPDTAPSRSSYRSPATSPC